MPVVRVLAISDTHNLHKQVKLAPADLFIFAGDLTVNGTKEETIDFIKWINGLDYKHKIMIAGNHETYLDGAGRSRIHRMLHSSVIYLENDAEEVLGLNVYGSPCVPRCGSPAFARERGNALRSVWRHIPDDTQLLVTHAPPFGILDKNIRDEECGCVDLRHRVNSLKHLHSHIFGHIHQSKGRQEVNGVNFYNVAYLKKDNKESTIFDLTLPP